MHLPPMKRFLWLPIAALVLACSGNTAPRPVEPPRPAPVAIPVDAAPPEPEPPIPALGDVIELVDRACPRVAAPFFYRVEKAGKVSHLLGTRHLSVALDKMPSIVKAELLKARLVVFETPPGDDSDSDEPPADPRPLSEQLGPDLWARYQRLAGEEVARVVDRSGPAAALLMLMVMYEHKFVQLDTQIQELVLDAKIKTAGLESSAFQDKLLSQLLDIRMLKATILGTPSRAVLRKESVEDLAEYCAGTDEDPGMDERTRKQLRAGGFTDDEITRMDKLLLDDRNNAWMPQLEKLFQASGVVVVVGADHLIGKTGLVAQLSTRGYQVTRVKP